MSSPIGAAFFALAGLNQDEDPTEDLYIETRVSEWREPGRASYRSRVAIIALTSKQALHEQNCARGLTFATPLELISNDYRAW